MKTSTSSSRRLAGFIDPSIQADTAKGREILATVRRLGLSLHRVHLDHRRAVRVTGPGGLHVVAASFDALTLADITSAA